MFLELECPVFRSCLFYGFVGFQCKFWTCQPFLLKLCFVIFRRFSKTFTFQTAVQFRRIYFWKLQFLGISKMADNKTAPNISGLSKIVYFYMKTLCLGATLLFQSHTHFSHWPTWRSANHASNRPTWTIIRPMNMKHVGHATSHVLHHAFYLVHWDINWSPPNIGALSGRSSAHPRRAELIFLHIC